METTINSLYSWLVTNDTTIITIFFVLVIAWLVRLFGGMIIRKTVIRAARSTAHHNKIEEAKRVETIVVIITGALAILIWPVTIIIIIAQLGVNIAPLIAGASILGLAIGFGAQSLVKDVITGLFVIFENQYRVGDVVNLNKEIMGYVEKITLRTTVLRDLDGVVHTVPNGTIQWTSNYSKDFSGINLDVAVGYDSNLEKVISIINQVGEDQAKDPDWKDRIIEKCQFLRVDNFGESSIDMKITGKVQPLAQWDVAGNLRQRIKLAFDKADIKIPFPQREIHTVKEK